MKRFDSKYIFSSMLSSFFTALIVVGWGYTNFFNDDESEGFEALLQYIPYAIAAFVVVYAALILYAWLYVRFSGYELREKDIRCKRGVLFRKDSVLDYARIHSVNKRQSLFNKLFGISVLLVDSGSTNTAFTAEISIIEKDSTVDSLMREIKSRQENKPSSAVQEEVSADRKNLYTFTSKRKVVLSAINMLGSAVIIAILAVIGVSVFAAAAPYITFSPDSTFLDLLGVTLLIALLAVFAAAIIAFIGSLLSSFLAYYNFCIYKEGSNIEVGYGLFVRNVNTFKRSRVKAIRIVEGLVNRLFGFAVIKISVVGYGQAQSNDGNNSAAQDGVLVPLCRKTEIADILSAIVPEYIPAEKENKAKSYPAFVLWSYLISSLIVTLTGAATVAVMCLCGASALAVSIALVCFCGVLAFVLILITVLGIFAFHANGVTVADDSVSVYSGGIVRYCTVIGKRDIIAMEDITTPLRAKKGIYTYRIHFFSNSATNTVTVKNLDEALTEKLRASVNS